MNKILFLFAFVMLFSFTQAQNESSKKALFKVSSFSSSIGFAGAMTSNTNADYFGLKDAVDDPDLFIDISGFKNQNNNFYGKSGFYDGSYAGAGIGGGNGSFVFNLGLTPYSKKLGKYRENRELRITIGSNFGSRNTFNYSSNTYTPIDTLQSINGSDVVYADSNIYQKYTYSLDFTSINFGISYIFKTDIKRRVHFYAGIGVNYGIALRSTVNVYNDDYRSVYYYNQYNPPSDNDDFYYKNYYDSNNYTYENSSTNLTNPMQFIRAYLPLGLSLRLSNKEKSFFNHVNLYTELNPGVEIQIIPNDKTYTNPYFGVAFIGFSYSW
jgi:hypothetical protein